MEGTGDVLCLLSPASAEWLALATQASPMGAMMASGKVGDAPPIIMWPPPAIPQVAMPLPRVWPR